MLVRTLPLILSILSHSFDRIRFFFFFFSRFFRLSASLFLSDVCPSLVLLVVDSVLDSVLDILEYALHHIERRFASREQSLESPVFVS